MVPGNKQETVRRLESFLAELSKNKAELPSPPRISVGVDEFGEDGTEPDELLDAADQAMYLAKNGGGHRIVLAGTTPGRDTDDYERDVLEAVVSVQARRYLPDRKVSVRDILKPLEQAVDTRLDSPLVRETLEVLMDAVEAKDPYTHAHSRAVSELALRLAEAMQFPHNEKLQFRSPGSCTTSARSVYPTRSSARKGASAPPNAVS